MSTPLIIIIIVAAIIWHESRKKTKYIRDAIRLHPKEAERVVRFFYNHPKKGDEMTVAEYESLTRDGKPTMKIAMSKFGISESELEVDPVSASDYVFRDCCIKKVKENDGGGLRDSSGYIWYWVFYTKDTLYVYQHYKNFMTLKEDVKTYEFRYEDIIPNSIAFSKFSEEGWYEDVTGKHKQNIVGLTCVSFKTDSDSSASKTPETMFIRCDKEFAKQFDKRISIHKDIIREAEGKDEKATDVINLLLNPESKLNISLDEYENRVENAISTSEDYIHGKLDIISEEEGLQDVEPFQIEGYSYTQSPVTYGGLYKYNGRVIYITSRYQRTWIGITSRSLHIFRKTVDLVTNKQIEHTIEYFLKDITSISIEYESNVDTAAAEPLAYLKIFVQGDAFLCAMRENEDNREKITNLRNKVREAKQRDEAKQKKS